MRKKESDTLGQHARGCFRAHRVRLSLPTSGNPPPSTPAITNGKWPAVRRNDEPVGAWRRSGPGVRSALLPRRNTRRFRMLRSGSHYLKFSRLDCWLPVGAVPNAGHCGSLLLGGAGLGKWMLRWTAAVMPSALYADRRRLRVVAVQ